ncbi:hypothetical protein [Psychrobacter pygoscelis]|uniref:hypothetical protein n=1 Tax=Psychrobacter pygoscelis TaxID=2488563 RepID=UPI00103CC8AF|nr:hypothetical protein [Psychrobacter pygoscelis]
MGHGNNTTISDRGLINHDSIMKQLGNGDKEFGEHIEGTAVNDSLTGQTVFSGEGNAWMNSSSNLVLSAIYRKLPQHCWGFFVKSDSC